MIAACTLLKISYSHASTGDDDDDIRQLRVQNRQLTATITTLTIRQDRYDEELRRLRRDLHNRQKLHWDDPLVTLCTVGFPVASVMMAFQFYPEVANWIFVVGGLGLAAKYSKVLFEKSLFSFQTWRRSTSHEASQPLLIQDA